MIISASRRTDIPCCYPEWFLNRLKEGYALIPNLRNANRLGRVELSPHNVDCIVFWTKNPAPMMELLPIIDEMGYLYYFEFTITVYGTDIERNLPEKETIIDTFKRLSDKIGPERVDWRFDPIIKNESYSIGRITEEYAKLCEQLHHHTKRCIISFVDDYSYTRTPHDAICRSEMLEIAKNISEIAGAYQLPVLSCSEKIDLSDFGIQHACCIDQNKIEELIGAKITAKKDTGQRPDCGCIESVDIGAYDTCVNGCTYCYATTNEKISGRRRREHDPKLPLLTGKTKGTETITDRTKPSQKIGQISIFD